MAEREDRGISEGTDTRRSAEKIRQDITSERESFTETVVQIGDRIREKMEWRSYVRHHPYLVLGVAAGLGFFASGIFKRRGTAIQQFVDALSNTVAKTGGHGMIKTTLYGIATNLAVNIIKNAASTALTSGSPEGEADYAEPDSSSSDKDYFANSHPHKTYSGPALRRRP